MIGALKELLAKVIGQAEFKTLLWTNPSPTSAFSGQTIVNNVDLSGYDFVEIEVFDRDSSQSVGNATSSRRIAVPSTGSVTGTIQVPSTNVLSYRDFTVTPTSIACNGAYWRPNYNGTGEYAITTLVVPARIYGIKLVGGGYCLAVFSRLTGVLRHRKAVA